MDAEIPETISALKDLTLNNLLPKEIVLAVKSANFLNSHTTLSHVINQTDNFLWGECLTSYLLQSVWLRFNMEKIHVVWKVYIITQDIWWDEDARLERVLSNPGCWTAEINYPISSPPPCMKMITLTQWDMNLNYFDGCIDGFCWPFKVSHVFTFITQSLLATIPALIREKGCGTHLGGDGNCRSLSSTHKYRGPVSTLCKMDPDQP